MLENRGFHLLWSCIFEKFLAISEAKSEKFQKSQLVHLLNVLYIRTLSYEQYDYICFQK
jgi:hypothetical protein